MKKIFLGILCHWLKRMSDVREGRKSRTNRFYIGMHALSGSVSHICSIWSEENKPIKLSVGTVTLLILRWTANAYLPGKLGCPSQQEQQICTSQKPNMVSPWTSEPHFSDMSPQARNYSDIECEEENELIIFWSLLGPSSPLCQESVTSYHISPMPA